MSNPRDHGLGDSGTPTGPPVAKPISDEERQRMGPCPNCGCKELMQIEVPMKHPLLKGGKGIGLYVGCPACPWASRCMTRATP